MHVLNSFHFKQLNAKKRKRRENVIEIKEIREWIEPNYITPKTSLPKPLIIFDSQGDSIERIRSYLYGHGESIKKDKTVSKSKIKNISSLHNIFANNRYKVELMDYFDDILKLNENINIVKSINQGKIIYIVKYTDDLFKMFESVLFKNTNDKKAVKEEIFSMIDSWFIEKKKFYNPIIFWVTKENKYTYYLRKYTRFVRHDYDNEMSENIYKKTEYFLMGTVNGQHINDGIDKNKKFVNINQPIELDKNPKTVQPIKANGFCEINHSININKFLNDDKFIYTKQPAGVKQFLSIFENEERFIKEDEDIPLMYIQKNLCCKKLDTQAEIMDNISSMDSIMGKLDSSCYGDQIYLKNNTYPYFYDTLFMQYRNKEKLTLYNDWKELDFNLKKEVKKTRHERNMDIKNQTIDSSHTFIPLNPNKKKYL